MSGWSGELDPQQLRRRRRPGRSARPGWTVPPDRQQLPTIRRVARRTELWNGNRERWRNLLIPGEQVAPALPVAVPQLGPARHPADRRKLLPVRWNSPAGPGRSARTPPPAQLLWIEFAAPPRHSAPRAGPVGRP